MGGSDIVRCAVDGGDLRWARDERTVKLAALTPEHANAVLAPEAFCGVLVSISIKLCSERRAREPLMRR
ncbi:MAG: hypothetical protein B7Y97_07090 [Sphingomonas sp. 32-66-10]|nr:MAG: hypothetical protein B7Y97_07090 [Sphingomonas sp. 32-66-10]